MVKLIEHYPMATIFKQRTHGGLPCLSENFFRIASMFPSSNLQTERLLEQANALGKPMLGGSGLLLQEEPRLKTQRHDMFGLRCWSEPT